MSAPLRLQSPGPADGYAAGVADRQAARAAAEHGAAYAALQALREENARLKGEVEALLLGQADAARRLLADPPPPPPPPPQSIREMEETLQSLR